MELPQGVVGARNTNWNWQGKKLAFRTREPDLNKAINRGRKGSWELGTFTVPISVSHERVQEVGYRYVRKFVDFLEGKGLRVHKVIGPNLDLGPFPVPADRRKYVISAFVSLPKPVKPLFNIPDSMVPEMLKAGLRLVN